MHIWWEEHGQIADRKSKISNWNFHKEVYFRLFIHRLNIAEAICWRQERQGVTRIQLLTWLNSLGNTSCPYDIKHAKLSAVSITPSCPLTDSCSAGVAHCPNWERAHMLVKGRWSELRGKERVKKGREEGGKRAEQGEGANWEAGLVDLWEQVSAKANMWQ